MPWYTNNLCELHQKHRNLALFFQGVLRHSLVELKNASMGNQGVSVLEVSK